MATTTPLVGEEKPTYSPKSIGAKSKLGQWTFNSSYEWVPTGLTGMSAYKPPAPVTPTTPAVGSSMPTTIESTQAEIERVKAEIARLQDIQATASKAGLSDIPDEVVAGTTSLSDWKSSLTSVLPPDTTQSDSYLAKVQAEIKSLESTIGEKNKELKALEKEGKTSEKSWLDFVTGKEKLDIEGKRKEIESKYGADVETYFSKRKEDLASVEALKKNYDTAVAARDLQLSAERERLGPMSLITARMDRMERDANIRLNQMSAEINTKLSIMAMERGDFMDAQNLIDQAINDYTTQFKWEYDLTKDYMAWNQTKIDKISDDKKEALNQILALKEKTWEYERQKAEWAADAIVKTKGQANIKLTDSLQDIANKWGKWEAGQTIQLSAKSSANDIGAYIQKRIREGEGWATIARELEEKGINTLWGSTADKALKVAFGQTGEETTSSGFIEVEVPDDTDPRSLTELQNLLDQGYEYVP